MDEKLDDLDLLLDHIECSIEQIDSEMEEYEGLIGDFLRGYEGSKLDNEKDFFKIMTEMARNIKNEFELAKKQLLPLQHRTEQYFEQLSEAEERSELEREAQEQYEADYYTQKFMEYYDKTRGIDND